MSLLPSNRFYLDDFFDDFWGSKTSGDLMKCDVYEKDNKYHVELDVPGYEKKDIKIDLTDGYLTIEASKEKEMSEENKNYIRKERSFGKFKRQFYVGDIKSNDVKADFNNGVLKISFPKDEVKKESNVIEIE